VLQEDLRFSYSLFWQPYTVLTIVYGDKHLPLDAILVFRVDLAADLARRIIETVNVDVGAPIAKAFK